MISLFENTHIFGAIAIMLIGYYIYSMRKKRDAINNPFSEDLRRETAPLEKDQKRRDEILKQGFLPKKVPEKVDVVVIGSGIGGLTVANILSRQGKSVLVLEQHDRAGGCCHTFREKGFEFDVGIHYITDVVQEGIAKTLIEQMSEGQIRWADMNEEYEVVMFGSGEDRREYSHKTGGEHVWVKNLFDMFPEEAEALERYMNISNNIEDVISGAAMLKLMPKWLAKLLVKVGLSKSINMYLSYAGTTTKTALEDIEMSPELQALICSSWADFGITPEESSFFMQLLINAVNMESSSYPVGGSSELILHMIPPIEKAGGRVLVRAPVSKILTDSSGKVTGVRVARSSGDIDIHAPMVVSNAGVMNTMEHLLEPEVAKASPMYHMVKENRAKPSVACIQVFVGLRGTAQELDLKAQNICLYKSMDYKGDLDHYLNLTLGEALEYPPPHVFISHNSAKDPTFTDRYPGKSTIIVIGACNPDWFEPWKGERVMKRGDDYEDMKKQFGQLLWEKVLSVHPQLEDKVEYMEVGTPLSNDYYLGTKHGEMYGLEHNIERFSNPETVINLRPESGIPGLYLTGQDIFTVGYVGAMMSGVLTASNILDRNIFDDLTKLEEKLKKES